MVRMMGIRQYQSSAQPVFHILAGHMIIYPPSEILGPGIGTIAPPGIVMWLIIEMPEGINKTTVDKVPYPLTLFRKEAGTFSISYRVMDVDGAMTNIIVARQN